MNPLISLHNHTTYSDGAQTPEEMVQEAIALGFQAIGFTDHSYVPLDLDFCMTPESTRQYQEEIRRLQKAYEGQIEILLGIEQDYYTPLAPEGFDYVIGSVHAVTINEDYIIADYSGENGRKRLSHGADKHFQGDVYALLECYYEHVKKIVDVTGCEIVGHLDVISLSNENNLLFDPEHPRYQKAWKEAVDCLLEKDVTFEVNLSPVIRGRGCNPHPSAEIQNYIKEQGGKMQYTGDCHSIEHLRAFREKLLQLPPLDACPNKN